MTSSEKPGAPARTGDSPLSGGYPAGGYVPPASPTADVQRAPTSNDPPATKDVAKDQASAVAGGAAEAAQHVAGVAKEQAGQVTAEASRQVKQLVGQARTELSSQAQSQQERAATGLRSVGDQLQAMASGSGQPGVAADLAKQASDKVHEIAGWLENTDPAAMLGDVRSFARQRPGVFLAVALGAGIVAGRLARGMTTDPDKAGQHAAQPSGPAKTGYVTPPVTGGYGTTTGTTPPPLPAGTTTPPSAGVGKTPPLPTAPGTTPGTGAATTPVTGSGGLR